MATRFGRIGGFRRFWDASPPLVAVGLALSVAGLVAMVGLAVDPRVITGSPAWLKPAKFGVSSATYCFTLAWLIASVRQPSGLLRGAGWVVAVVLGLEVAIIDLQAARGTTSHFNIATPLDAALFAVMGIGIASLLVASAVAAVALCRAKFADRAWGWALRLGMVVTVVGSTTGGLMVRPTAAQQAEAARSGTQPINGAHTVGGTDGGPGMPVTGWSRNHGDLRVPHFFGLHAVQAIPLLVWLLGLGLPLRSERVRIALAGWVAASYLALIGLLTWQALAGRPVVGGDPLTLGGFVAWAVLSAAGIVVLVARERSRVESFPQAVGV